MPRPDVSTIVPFHGTPAELSEALARLATLERQAGDEVVVVWNSNQILPDLPSLPKSISILAAPDQASSYYARNVGVRATSNDWLLFMDADCSPAPGLLGLYFAEGDLPDDVGIVAGDVIGVAGDTLVERYTIERHHIRQASLIENKPLGFGMTANLLVRRRVWAALNGFAEGVVSGGDADFCWRAQLAGVALAFNPEASVSHFHRQSVRALWQQFDKYGRGDRWLGARHGHARARRRPPLVDLARSFASPLRHGIHSDVDDLCFGCLDIVAALARCVGWFRGDTAPLLSSEPHER